MENTLKQLSTLLKTNDDYLNYLNAKSELMKNEELIEKVKQYRIENFDFNNKSENGEHISFEYEAYISKLYTNLLLNKVTADYILYEEKVLDLLNGIYETVEESIDISFEL